MAIKVFGGILSTGAITIILSQNIVDDFMKKTSPNAEEEAPQIVFPDNFEFEGNKERQEFEKFAEDVKNFSEMNPKNSEFAVNKEIERPYTDAHYGFKTGKEEELFDEFAARYSTDKEFKEGF